MSPDPQIPVLIDHLFRYESGKMVSVLTRIFGSHHLQLAEDVVQDTLLQALNSWNYNGVPQHPSAWLYTVAKNNALNIIRRDQYQKQFNTEAAHLLKSEWTTHPAMEHLFSEQEIVDDQLRMMFTCCHPSIAADSQVGLILRTLCGFSIPEITRAFLSTPENINKRLVRARQKIRDSNIIFEVPSGTELEKRTKAVLEAVYLLFNEGYSASSGNDIIRSELCEEAIRLAGMIAVHPLIAPASDVNALLALMLFNASRFPARTDHQGNILPMSSQDRSRWDKERMQQGFHYLRKEEAHEKKSIYHLLAAISAQHCTAPDFASTDWKSILFLYDSLAKIDDSPVVILNRSIALAKVSGAAAALKELEQLKSIPSLQSYYLYHATRAELHLELSQFAEAAAYFRKAIHLAPLKAEKEHLQRKLSGCIQKIF